MSDIPLDLSLKTPNVKGEVNLDETKERELKYYRRFVDWKKERNVTTTTEGVMMNYVRFLSSTNAPNSLHTLYNKLVRPIHEYEKVDIDKFEKVKSWLKEKRNKYEPRKYKELSAEELDRFFKEAPDKDYLLQKVILIFQYVGRLTQNQTFNMTLADLDDRGDSVIVSINHETTKSKFSIGGDYYVIYKRYADLRPATKWTNYFFVDYRKPFNQRIGKNVIREAPKVVARCLNLKDPEAYSSHFSRGK